MITSSTGMYQHIIKERVQTQIFCIMLKLIGTLWDLFVHARLLPLLTKIIDGYFSMRQSFIKIDIKNCFTLFQIKFCVCRWYLLTNANNFRYHG